MKMSAEKVIVAALILFTLMACGGGGGESPQVTISANVAEQVKLGEQGMLMFPVNSLPAGTEILIAETELPPLVTDLVALGVAYRVETTSQPTIPVEISLQIPPATNTDNLVIVRVEDDGTITLLQTEVVDQHLVAYTPGFSIITIAQMRGALSGINKPKISGPDSLPSGVVGQYQEDAMTGIPGLERKWKIADGNGELTVSQDPLGNSSARLKGLLPGVIYLSVRFHIPGTSVYASAQKKVRIMDALDSFGEGLRLTVYAPDLVRKDSVDSPSETFDVTARILNTDVSEVSKWECRILYYLTAAELNCGGCVQDCGKTFTLNNFFLDQSTSAILRFTAYASHNGLETFGEALHTIRTTQEKPVLTSLTGNTTTQRWSSLLPNADINVTATIQGGVPPYNYNWSLQPKGLAETHTHDGLTDQLSFTLRQPGNYALTLTVIDSKSRGSQTMVPVQFMPAKDFYSVKSSILNIPHEAIILGQPVTLTFSATGSFLIHDGRQGDYAYAIDWGDGTDLTTGYLVAQNVVDGGRIIKSHTYTSINLYPVRFYALPDWVPDVESVIRAMLANSSDPQIDTEHISVVAASPVLPQIQVTASDSSATEEGDTASFLFTRDGDLTEPLAIAFSLSGSASSVTDYTLEKYSLVTIPAGQNSLTLMLTPRLDTNESEGEETVVLTIKPAAGYDVGSQNTALITISDYVKAPTLVSIVASDNSASERGLQTASFTLTRSGDLRNSLRVNLSRAGTASYSTDFIIAPSFTSSTTSILIPAGETSVEFTLTPRDDAIVEGEETVELSIDTSPFYEIGASGFVTLFIVDRGPVRFLLQEVTYGKVADTSDLCGDIQTCMHFQKEASFHDMNDYWTIGATAAEYTFDEVYTLNNAVLTDYAVNFTFAAPAAVLTGGETIPLNVSGVAQGFISGWSIGRSFTYFVRNDINSWSPSYNYDGQLYLYNRDLPNYDEATGQFSGSLPGNSTTQIAIPNALQQDLIIGGRFGWDPPLFIQWVYKLEQ